jgi:hypothetical protein
MHSTKNTNLHGQRMIKRGPSFRPASIFNSTLNKIFIISLLIQYYIIIFNIYEILYSN